MRNLFKMVASPVKLPENQSNGDVVIEIENKEIDQTAVVSAAKEALKRSASKGDEDVAANGDAPPVKVVKESDEMTAESKVVDESSVEEAGAEKSDEPAANDTKVEEPTTKVVEEVEKSTTNVVEKVDEEKKVNGAADCEEKKEGVEEKNGEASVETVVEEQKDEEKVEDKKNE